MLGPLGSALQDKGSPEEKGKVEVMRCIWGRFRSNQRIMAEQPGLGL